MSIQIYPSNYDTGYCIIVPEDLKREFEEVIKRGTAFGSQTSPEMKRFADSLLGRISYTAEGNMLKSKVFDTSNLTSQIVEN